MMRAAALTFILASAPAAAAEEKACTRDSLGACAVDEEDASVLLSTRIQSHAASETGEEGQGLGCQCALGKNVRVVTDMGYDDMGAFSVLNAAGCTPQKALAVEGMMPSSFAGNWQKLLTSWGLDTKVYQGPVGNATCYNPDGKAAYVDCLVNIEWLPGYRAVLQKQYPELLGPHHATTHVSTSVEAFWDCQPGEEYTLLVISPQSAVAEELLGPRGAATRKCIKRIVFMGGMFNNLQLQQTDPVTFAAVDGPLTDAPPVNDTSDASLNTETNIISDVPAAYALWQESQLGLPMDILSLETASNARSGVQRLFLNGQTAGYSVDDQFREEVEALKRLQKRAGCGHRKQQTKMLDEMICIKSGADQATLDFDAIAASYVWLGGADERLPIHLEPSDVVVDRHTGVTTRTVSKSSSMSVATTFDALMWYEKLGGLLWRRS